MPKNSNQKKNNKTQQHKKLSAKEQGFEYFKNKEYKKALDVFSQIFEQEKEDVEICNTAGLCYYYLNDYDNAEKYFVKTLNLNMHQIEAYINLSDVYYRQKLFAEAEDLLQVGISKNPENTVLKHYLARIYLEDSQPDLALYELDSILEKEPENYDAYYDLGQAHFKLGNWASAAECFENVLEFKDDNAFVYYYLGETYLANDETDKALSNFLKATALNNQFALPYKKAAVLFMSRGETQDAIEYFEDYLKFELPQQEIDQVKKLVSKLKGNTIVK